MIPDDFHHLSTELLTNGGPAHIRTAISRAYYAFFHVGAELLREMGFTIRTNANGHVDVSARLSNTGDADVDHIGWSLDTLRGKRIDADYDIGDRDIEGLKTASSLVEQTGEMILQLRALCKGPKREQLIESIKDWEIKAVARPKN
jgi:uncharacterized protein (UPF0332 family)